MQHRNAFFPLGFGILLWPGVTLAAVLVSIPDSVNYKASTACPQQFGVGAMCQTQAYLDDTTWPASKVLAGSNSNARVPGAYPAPGKNIFLEAFTTWNTSSGGQGWTLADGTAGGTKDLNGTISITSFSAMSFDSDPKLLGGVQVTWDINITSGLPALGPNQQYVWAQALYDNTDFSKERPVAPFFEMDITNNTCVPAYKCYGGAYATAGPFNDRVRLPFFGNFFEAEAFYGIADKGSKTLTLFTGMDYGFVNSVAAPVPPAWILLASGTLLLGLTQARNDLRCAL